MITEQDIKNSVSEIEVRGYEVINPKYELSDIECGIFDASSNISVSSLKIAYLVKYADDHELYKAHDYTDIISWGKEMFGYEKSTIYNFRKIGNIVQCVKIGDCEGYRSIFYDGYTDFGFSQLAMLLPYNISDVKKWLHDGTIKADMSTRELSKALKAITGKPTKSKSKKEPDQPKTQEPTKFEPLEKKDEDFAVLDEHDEVHCEGMSFDDIDSKKAITEAQEQNSKRLEKEEPVDQEQDSKRVENEEEEEMDGIILYDQFGKKYCIPSKLFDEIKKYEFED